MKLLSIIIPSFNSEKFLADCLDSLLIGEDEQLDVIVVNDGSKDKTSEIAHSYADKHSFIRVIDKENGGHGSGINAGLPLAEGLFFKVLDSDDHLDTDGLKHLLRKIEQHVKENTIPDVYVADYLSVSIETGDQTLSSLHKRFPKDECIIPIEKIGHMTKDEYFMMHFLFARTALLKETNLNLLEKTFYEDNQFVLHVVKYAQNFCYLLKPIYLYSIGRADQSVSLTSINKNYPHQVRVMSRLAEMVPYEDYKLMSKKRKMQVLHELYIVEVLTYFDIYIMPTKEKKELYYSYIKKFKKENRKVYRRLKHKTLVFFIWYLPPFLRAFATKLGFKLFGKKKGWVF